MNKGFKVPDTYVIIFFVVCFAALLTYLIPQGLYQTEDITYVIDGAEKTRTVIKDGSFSYVLDDAGNPVKQASAYLLQVAALDFSTTYLKV